MKAKDKNAVPGLISGFIIKSNVSKIVTSTGNLLINFCIKISGPAHKISKTGHEHIHGHCGQNKSHKSLHGFGSA
jgi:hypothetical protein